MITDTSVFGAIKIVSNLEDSVKTTLNDWWLTYSREVEIQEELPDYSLPVPVAFLTSAHVDREASPPMPGIVVVSPGMGSMNPKQEGDGSFRTFWRIGIAIFVSARDRNSSGEMLRLYGGIARSIMLQKQDLGGFASGTQWLDESYDDVFTFTDGQTAIAGQLIFEVEVSGVVNRWGGPMQYSGHEVPPDPDTQPGSNWPRVKTVFADIEVKE